ncbi:MAG: AAA family ATPase [Alistipes sp.]
MKKDTDIDSDTTVSSSTIRLSADTVLTNISPLIDEGILTSDDRSQISWLIGEMRRTGLSMSDIGRRIGYDASTISKVFSATYKGSWENVILSIKKYRHLTSERAKMSSATFIETTIWEKIRQTCDIALINQMPATIIGVSQIGKTSALLEYQRRSEYVVRYMRMPAAPSFRAVLESIADATGVTTRERSEVLRRRIAHALDSRTLLIIDELHQLAISSGPNTAMKVMEYIRELLDVTGCGLVVCGTKSLQDDLICGPLKNWLDQFDQRCIKRLILPNELPADDIALIAHAYGLPPPEASVYETVRHLRMNRLVKILMLSANLARNREEPISWDHFSTSYELINR